jgi:hypothetical protein
MKREGGTRFLSGAAGKGLEPANLLEVKRLDDGSSSGGEDPSGDGHNEDKG